MTSTSPAITLTPPGAGLVWHGIDLHWAYSALLGDIRRRTGCLHRAYDVLHDALVRFALVVRRAPVREPHAYLRSVVRTVLVDHYREESRWVALPESEDDEAPLPAGLRPGFAPSAEHLADLNQRLHLLQEILDTLPTRRREVFWLYRVEGLRQADIAAKLSISVTMVERHLMRALADLYEAREALA